MMNKALWTALLASLLVMGACEAPNIDEALWSCSSQADCGPGFVCAQALGACVVPDNSADGVESDTITLGMSAALSAGPSSAGAALQAGVEALFANINANGGVDGRQLVLKVVDDGGDPDRALTNIQDMVRNGEVFAIIGGTTVTPEIVDFLVSNKRIFFAPASGSAELYQDPPDRYVFQLRPSAENDLDTLINYTANVRGVVAPPENLAVFAESRGGGLSPRGESARQEVVDLLDGRFGVSGGDLFVATHDTDSLDMDEAVGESLHWLANDREKGENGQATATFVLASNAAPSAAFVRDLLDELFEIKSGTSNGLAFELTPEEVSELLQINEVVFTSPSELDSDKLSVDLKNFGTYQTLAGDRPYCASVVSSRAVPSVESGASVVIDYREALGASSPGTQPNHLGLEGYIAARVLVEALRLNGPALSTEDVVNQLEALELDLGLGTAISFSPSDRVALERIRGAGFEGEDCQELEIDLGEPAENNEPIDNGDCEGGTCVLTGTITEDLTLTSDKRWLLRGSVFVGDGSAQTTLEIEPGTTILGEQATTGILIIRRGSKIVADGTREAPIVFTSSNAPGSRAAGDWGGLIINGRAPINGCDDAPCEAFGEGGTGFFGGDDPNDDSGILRYVRVEFAGKLLSPNNELNGIAFQGVGDRTVVEFIQVHRGADDGVEFFGGTVNFKNILTTGIEDDNLDWTFGWQGKGQYFIAQQWDGFGDNGIEADNREDERDLLPRSNPTLCNITLVGVPTSDSSDYGMLLREGTGADISGAVVAGWNAACLDIDHPETFANAVSDGETPELTGGLTISQSLFDCATPFEEDNEDAPDPYPVSNFVTELNEGNATGSPALADAFNTVSPDFRPDGEGSPAASTAAECPNDAFFDQTDFIGGMSPSDDWTLGWTTNVEN